jgi:excisionase family DNA binding protein
MTNTFNRLRFLNHFTASPRPASRLPDQPAGATPAAIVPAGSADGLSVRPAAEAPVTAARFLTVPEVAAILGVSEKTVQRRLRAGLLRQAPLGGRIVRVPAAELARLAGTETPQKNLNTTKDV